VSSDTASRDPGFRAVIPDAMRPPSGAYSTVVATEQLVFVAGQGPFDKDGRIVGSDCATQTIQVIENLRHALRSVGCDLANVVKTSAFLASLDDFEAFNSAYAKHFVEPLPVRTTVQAGLRGFLVELDVIAIRPA
jgi:reactive intermediate/imine deaminase